MADPIDDTVSELTARMNAGIELHNRIAAVMSGQEVMTVALHGHMLRRTLQTLNPGIWEIAGNMVDAMAKIKQDNEGH